MRRFTRHIVKMLLPLALVLFCPPYQQQAKAGNDPFIGEIILFAGTYAPRGWAFCNGQLLPISQNQALFALLGTTYGGDGRTTFALPDLRGRAPIHAGQGPGLSSRRLGDRGGFERVPLQQAEIPQHTHSTNVTVQVKGGEGNSATPAGNYLAKTVDGRLQYYQKPADGTVAEQLAPEAVNVQEQAVGGDQAHYNMQPFLTLNYIIALQGTFPPRN